MAVELLVMAKTTHSQQTIYNDDSQLGSYCWLVAGMLLLVSLMGNTARSDDAPAPALSPPPTGVPELPTNASASPVDAAAPAANSEPPASNPGQSPPAQSVPATSIQSDTLSATDDSEAVVEHPWDFSPYRVQIWISSDNADVSASQLAGPLTDFFDREFASLWQLSINDAPQAISTAASRNLAALNYNSITSADPVIAVKRNHVDAPRIRFTSDVGNYVKQCISTKDRIADIIARGKAVGNEGLSGVAKLLQAVDGDALAVIEKWNDPDTEAIVTTRAMALQLKNPDAKIISLPIDSLVAETIDRSDKVFIVHVETAQIPWTVSVVEIDCLMRNFSVMHRRNVESPRLLVSIIRQAVTEVFAPLVRIEDAGQKTADGLVRAHGLITDDASPALIKQDDFLVPMTRKDDRNGDPIGIGPLSWAYLHVKEVNGAKVKMDYHAGKAGGLQGRQNKRTFRTATRIRPLADSTTVRLHVQRNPAAPLVGYEVYEKGLTSTAMTFVGRTDWDGRLEIGKTDFPMRLLYVKNGGAVLARLPVVPGQSELEVADLFGDDQRLRAEAYIRGTQNAIVDLVAIRQLFAARIRMRLEKGKLQEAKELLEVLRNEPTYEKIAGDMGRKLLQLKGRNGAEQMKIDQMFAQTREMLVKNINPALIRDLEAAVLAAERTPQAAPATAAQPDASAENASSATTSAASS